MQHVMNIELFLLMPFIKSPQQLLKSDSACYSCPLKQSGSLKYKNAVTFSPFEDFSDCTVLNVLCVIDSGSAVAL